jgi:prepilin-type N-terminal cleavage/methylation domain-containing protein
MNKQRGFTLIEIAIVLVIIGLLLGGVLKGQELITSARVRNLISLQDGVKAAYFGFQDRFRALPGDYLLATTNIANVVATAACNNGNGDGNGRILPGVAGANEDILAWEHLSRSGFLTGTYTCAAAASPATSPTNPYTVPIQLDWDGIYGNASGGVARHNLKTGNLIPVDILAEIDRKIDDGLPYAGTFQFSLYGPTNPPTETAGGAGAVPCILAGPPASWNIAGSSANCGAATVF